MVAWLTREGPRLDSVTTMTVWRRKSPGWLPPPPELALAVAVTALMAVSLNQAARPTLSLLVVVPAGLSLAWRLQQPLLPLALTCAADLLLTATAPGQYGPQTVFFGVLLSLYTAASRLSGRLALATGILSLGSVYATFVSAAEGDADDFFPFLLWGVPWLAGRLVRRQTLQALDAGARAALLEVEARESASRERDRIARELHDVVAHAVSLMVVQAGAERMSLPQGADRTRACLDAIETTGRQALVELRTMLGVLRATDNSDELLPQPDLAALPRLVESVRAAGLAVELDVTGRSDAPAGVGLAAYRVVQEALTNALRHGGGSAVVQVKGGDRVTIEVRSPLGKASEIGAGRGLIGMKERVELFGGSVSAGPVGSEWVVSADIPRERERVRVP